MVDLVRTRGKENMFSCRLITSQEMDIILKISHVYDIDRRLRNRFGSSSNLRGLSTSFLLLLLFFETSLTYPNVLIINIVNFTSSRLYISTLKFLYSLFLLFHCPDLTKNKNICCCLSR